jgi:hypothetical protein
MTWRFLLQKRASLSPGEAASKRRVYIFILCMAISAMFWLFNKLSQETSASFSQPVIFTAFPEGLVAASQSDSIVTYSLRTTGIRLISAYFFNPPDTLFVSSEGLPVDQQSSTNHKFVDASRLLAMLENRFGQWAAVENVQPDTVFVELVPVITKRLPVKLDADISFEQRFRLYGEINIEPDSILVTGPASILDTLEYIATVHWSSGRLRQSTGEIIRLKKPLPLKSLQLETETIQLSIPVAEYTESSIELPLQIINPAHSTPVDLRLFPNKVTVSYLVALNDYASVSEHMFRASVPCPETFDSDDGRLPVQLESYPSFVEVLQITPPFIEYIIIE